MKTLWLALALLPTFLVVRAQTVGPVTPAQPTQGAASGSSNSSTGVVTPAVPAVPVVTPPVTPPVTPVTPVTPIDPTTTTALPASTGETTITLDIAFGIRAVPAARVTVPVGETLRISAPAIGSKIQWQKNGRALAGATSNPLVIARVDSSDAGTYTAVNNDPAAFGFTSQSLVLGVGPTDRLLNLSTRGLVTAGGEGLICGFVVSGTQSKRLILRAVGPSLALFGVASPLRRPVLRVFDSQGQPYTNGYAYPAVVGGPTYASDLAESLARTGAFPFMAGTADAVVMMPFAAGAYTAHVTSGDGTSGTALLEIYEVP